MIAALALRRVVSFCRCSSSPHRAFGARASRRRSAAGAAALAGEETGASPPPPPPLPSPPPAAQDLLVLAASLLREHGGSLEPSLLKSRMRDAWAGAPGAAGGARGLPSGIAFVRQFPSVFSVEWGVRRLGGDAVAEFERFARRVRLNEGAPVQMLERASAASAEPAVYGPILEEVLRRAGGYLPLRALTLRLQLAALERGARLPPPGVNWFILHPSPSYARLRPVWGAKVGDDGYLHNEGVMLVEGETVVEYEARELRKLAAGLEANEAAAAAAAAAAAPAKAPPVAIAGGSPRRRAL
jgi:hypothetical protein